MTKQAKRIKAFNVDTQALMTVEAARLVETTVRDSFEHWLASAPQQALKLLDFRLLVAYDAPGGLPQLGVAAKRQLRLGQGHAAAVVQRHKRGKVGIRAAG